MCLGTNITGVHLETNQKALIYFKIRSVIASFFQLKQTYILV